MAGGALAGGGRPDRGPAGQPAAGGRAPPGPGGGDRGRPRWSSRSRCTSLLAATRRAAGRPGPPGAAGVAYLAALGAGIALALAGRPLPGPGRRGDLAGGAAGPVPAARLRYARLRRARPASGCSGSAIGAVLAADAALVCGGAAPPGRLARPGRRGEPGHRAGVPLGADRRRAAGAWPAGRPPAGARAVAGRVQPSSVAAIYLVIVLGLGQRPGDHGDREILGLSMLAAAVAAVGYLPARDRLMASATRFVYGAREAPDEVLRTFGSRLTRAIPMDELLLQLAESLRKTMAPDQRRGRTPGRGDVLERAVSVPGRGAPVDRSSATEERPVVTRAGVSGSAWASIWLPGAPGRAAAGPAAGRADQPRRRAARPASSSSGPADADAFTEEDDRVLTELARQVGLALHNVQLDSALQATLDELRHAGRRAARVPRPHRGQRRRRAPPGRAQPARRRPAAPGGAGRQPAAGPRHRRPTTRRPAREMLDQLADDVQDDDPGAARAGPRHLPAAAGRQRPGRGAARRGQPQPARRSP